MFISSCFNNYSIESKKYGNLKNKSYASGGIRTHNPCGFEATEHMRKENCRKRL